MLVSELIEKLEEARFSFTDSDAPVEIYARTRFGILMFNKLNIITHFDLDNFWIEILADNMDIVDNAYLVDKK